MIRKTADCFSGLNARHLWRVVAILRGGITSVVCVRCECPGYRTPGRSHTITPLVRTYAQIEEMAR